MHDAARVLIRSDVKKLANNTRSSGRLQMRRRRPFTTDDKIHTRQTHTGRRAETKRTRRRTERFGREGRFASLFLARRGTRKIFQKLRRKTFFRANRVYAFETTNRPHSGDDNGIRKKQNKNTARAKKNNEELIAGRPNENGWDEKKITIRLRERTRCDRHVVQHAAMERHYTLGRQPDGNKMWWDAAGLR